MKRVQQTIIHSQPPTAARRMVQQRDSSQINAVNKIQGLPSVSVSTQPRIIRQSMYATTVPTHKCFICDEKIAGQVTSLTDSETITSREKVTKKLAKMVGDDFCVIVSEDDVICRRCLTLFNTMDKYEFDLENVRSRLRGFINQKYSIDEDEPPAKMQKLNSSNLGVSRWQNSSDDSNVVRKTAAENQLKTMTSPPGNNAVKRGPVKLYKCIACDFKTTDLEAFQPHSKVCKGQSKNSTTPPARNVRQSYSGPASVQKPNLAPQKVGGTTIIRNNLQQTQLQCRTCSFKTSDRALFNEHQRNHQKPCPFKCRMCLERFPTREAAQIHAKIHSNPANSCKCGICHRQFPRRDLLEAHMKTHEKFKSVSQDEVIVLGNKKNAGQIQKPLTDIIKEALSEDDQDGVNELIEFHSCNLCSLTFVNKKLYAQHMKTHESPSDKAGNEAQTALTKGKQQDTLGDLESIFEKMHSDNVHHTTSANGATNDKNVLITTQEGGITYNITIPQDDVQEQEDKQIVRIDMPNLDDTGDSQEKTEVHVSMPSLHDEENTQSSQEQTEVPMDLDDLQNAAGEGQQLKFIVDENGQFLQLDNHILTTDAEGNQILVQGTDQEQLQHLLQSVGVDGNQVLVQLQGNGEEIDGDGTTLQMLGGDENQGQMILVQGADGESQLIDASMLQTEGGGNLVLQQGADGQTHLTTADGIPVSVSFSGEGGEGHITVTMASGHEEEGQQIFLQQSEEGQEHAGEAEEFSQPEENSQESAAVDDPLSSQEAQPEEASTENVTSTTDVETKTEEAAPVEEAPTTETQAEEKKEESTESSEKSTENASEEKM